MSLRELRREGARAWRGALWLVVLAFAPSARADEAQSPEEAATLVLAAFDVGDRAAIERLAGRAEPDAWLVADALLALGEDEAARAYATAWKSGEAAALRAWIETRTGGRDDAKRRAAMSAATAAWGRADGAAVLAAVAELGSPVDDVLEVRLARIRGLALGNQGRPAEGGIELERGAEIAARLGWMSRAAYELHAAALAATLRSDGPRAAALWESARAIHARSGDRAALAATLRSLGEAYTGLARHDEARAALTEALAIFQERGDRKAAGKTHLALGALEQAQGRYAEALVHAERSAEESRAAGDARTEAGARMNAANAHMTLGAYDPALAAYGEALALWDRLGDGEGQATVLGNLALVHERRGDLVRALEMQEEVLAMRERTGPPASLATTLANVGNLRRQIGELPSALRCYARALDLARASGDPAQEGLVLTNLSQLHARMGDLARSLALAEEAVGIRRRTGNPASLANALLVLAAAQAQIGDRPAALLTRERAVASARESHDPAVISRALSSYGGSLYRARRVGEALRCYGEAVALFESVGDRVGLIGALLDAAELHRDAGEGPKAREALDRALGLARQTGARLQEVQVLDRAAEQHLAEGNAPEASALWREVLVAGEEIGSRTLQANGLDGMARARLQLGDPGAAAGFSARAVALVPTLVGGLAEGQGAEAAERYAGFYETGLRAARALGDVEQVAHFLESGRAGRLLEALGGRDALRAYVIPEDLRRLEAQARAEEAVAARALESVRRGGPRTEVRRRREQLAARREAVRAVLERIQREAKAGSNLVLPAPAPLGAIRESLRDGEALVVYGFLPDDAFALVVTPKEARVVGLPAPEQLAETVSRLGVDEPGEDPRERVDALRGVLLDPLGLGADVRRLLVSPAGPVATVPFAALSGDREVVAVPSATTYRLLREDARNSGAGVLALGGPRAMGLPDLPGSESEARSVGDVVLVGPEATKAGLRRVLASRERWRSVHLACHGLVDVARPTLSALVLTPSDEDDGRLTALDVFQMHVAADLAFLSACETGKGRVVEGEGLIGLTRAFMYAGTPRVIVSLWQVDDDATRALATRFYERWKPGVPAAAALQGAQDDLRSEERWRHPYYWAAWTLWGLAD